MTDTEKRMTFTPLSTTLKTVHDGRTKFVLEAIDDALAAVVSTLHRLGGKGTVALVLSLKQEKGTIVVDAIVNHKMPQTGPIPARFYVDKFGQLVEGDPEQPPLFTANFTEGTK